MYSGQIEGVDHGIALQLKIRSCGLLMSTHQIFIEPKVTVTDEPYITCFSTCLPLMCNMKWCGQFGVKMLEILPPAYAVEYDYSPPRQLHPSLETKPCRTFSGRPINGTWIHMWCQGLVLDQCSHAGKEPVVLRRSAHGVLTMIWITGGTTAISDVTSRLSTDCCSAR